MKNKKKLILILSALFLLLTAASLGYYIIIENMNGGNGAVIPVADNTATEDSEPAIDFTVLADDGNTVMFSEMKGRPMVINFWASYCYACTKELPAFENAYNQYKGEIEFMMIDRTDGTKETKRMAVSYIEKKGYTFPVYYDTEGEAFSKLRCYGVPMTFFVDSDGNIVSYISGEISEEELISRIEELL